MYQDDLDHYPITCLDSLQNHKQTYSGYLDKTSILMQHLIANRGSYTRCDACDSTNFPFWICRFWPWSSLPLLTYSHLHAHTTSSLIFWHKLLPVPQRQTCTDRGLSPTYAPSTEQIIRQPSSLWLSYHLCPNLRHLYRTETWPWPSPDPERV